MSDAGDAAEEAVRTVWERRRPEAEQRLDALESVVAALVERRLTPELRREGEVAAHKLAGSLGSFGFPRGSELAFQAEALLGGEGDLRMEDAPKLAEWTEGIRDDISRPPTLLSQVSPVPSAGSAAESGTDRPNVDVVLVEDDAILAELLTQGLKTAGYSQKWIDDGGNAVRRLTGPHPELIPRIVLLDVDLPAVSGLGILRAMSESGRLSVTRVIMLTARSTEQETVETFELGAFDHVAKPFSLPVLLQRVRRAMED